MCLASFAKKAVLTIAGVMVHRGDRLGVYTKRTGDCGSIALCAPQWQEAAGGTMAFEVASVKQRKPGAFAPPNFPSITATPSKTCAAARARKGVSPPSIPCRYTLRSLINSR